MSPGHAPIPIDGLPYWTYANIGIIHEVKLVPEAQPRDTNS